jgi:hypothetical protein
MQNPFILHKEILLDGGCSSSFALQHATLNMYQNWLIKFDLSSIKYLNDKNFEALLAMMRHYRIHGESCPHFISIAEQIKAQEGWRPDSAE